MRDPYETLGVPRDASDEDIKKAYRDLARKYHPDNYVDNPLADLVEEKMKEINEAYDTIQKERARGSSGTNAGGYRGDQSYGGYHAGNSGSGNYARIRTLLNEQRFSEAEIMLDAIPATEHTAEWHFLKGCVLVQRRRYYDALRSIETACYMDPDNPEYQQARASLKNSTSAYGGRDDACDICAGLLCANMLCNCCR